MGPGAALSQVLSVDIQESPLNALGRRERKVQPRIPFKEKGVGEKITHSQWKKKSLHD